MINFGDKADGVSIEIKTGLNTQDTDTLLQRISFQKVIEWCKDTGHNLVTWNDGFACLCKKSKNKDKYVIMLGKDDNINI